MNLNKKRMGWIDQPAILGGVPFVVKEWPEYNTIGEREKKAVIDVLESGVLSGFTASADASFLGGPAVLKLETEWSDAFQVKHAVAMNSATSALFAAVSACEISAGDEVILDPLAMSGAAAAILGNVAIPVFADVNPHSMNLDPETLENCISPRTKVIIVIHHAGFPAEMNQILMVAKKYGLAVIEDNAQAPGATYHGQFTGTIGHIGVFSLNSNKIIQAGEGGIAVTDDDQLAQRLRLIRNHGEKVVPEMDTQQSQNLLGFNLRMTELTAAVAAVQLDRLNDLKAWQIRLANHLTQRIRRDYEFIAAPEIPEDCTHVYSGYRLEFDAEVAGINLALFAEAIQAEGVPVRIGPSDVLYHQPIYRDRSIRGNSGFPFGKKWYDGYVSYDEGICPQAESLVNNSLFIDTLIRYPISTEDMDRVLDAFSKVIMFKEEIVAWDEAGRPERSSKFTSGSETNNDEHKQPTEIEQPKLTEAEIVTPESISQAEHGESVVIALGSEAYGSAYTLAPVAEVLMERLDVELHVAVSGSAMDVFGERFRTRLKHFDEPDKTKQNLDTMVEEWIVEIKPDVVLSGLTGPLDRLDFAMQRAAKKRGIKTVAVLDSWTRLSERLSDPDRDSPQAYLPDKYGIPDFTTALEYANLGVDKSHLQLVGHPLHNDLKRMIQQWRLIRDRSRRWMEVDPNMDLVVFFSEPLADQIEDGIIPNPGYNEFDALNTTASGLARLYRKHACVLAVKEQAEQRSFGDRLQGGELGGVRVIDITDSPLNEFEWLLAADVIVGMSSPMLVHSACVGMHTIVMQPNLIRRNDRNPLTRRGLLSNHETPDDLANEINKHDDQDKRTLARIRKEFRWNEDAAANVAKMVVELCN